VDGIWYETISRFGIRAATLVQGVVERAHRLTDPTNDVAQIAEGADLAVDDLGIDASVHVLQALDRIPVAGTTEHRVRRRDGLVGLGRGAFAAGTGTYALVAVRRVVVGLWSAWGGGSSPARRHLTWESREISCSMRAP